jgi:hypothetical protein
MMVTDALQGFSDYLSSKKVVDITDEAAKEATKEVVKEVI